jgi:hypothetical protein
VWGCTGDQNDHLGLVAVEEAARHRRVPGIGDLRLDGASAVGELRKLRLRARYGDHGSSLLGEGASDRAAQAAARTDDDGGFA